MQDGRRRRWRDLPAALPGPCGGLVADLRELKDRSGLNLVRLAEATAVSTSSWERYLNGKQLPPRPAVRALCRVAHADERPVLARWALADAAWSGREERSPATGAAADQAGAGGGGTSREAAAADAGRPVRRQRRVRRGRGALVAASGLIARRPVAAGAGVLLLCAAMLVPAALYHASRVAAARPAAAPPPICRLASCQGRDPRTTACEDPTTLAAHTAADGTRLEIRLSPSCRAAWVRARPAHAGFRIELAAEGAPPHGAAGRGTATAAGPAAPNGTGPATTTMIAAPQAARLRACYRPAAGRRGRECFTAAAGRR